MCRNQDKRQQGIRFGLIISFALGAVFSQSQPASAQWTASGNNIYYNAGTVGIGTTTPGAQLHINSSGETIYWGNGPITYPSTPALGSGNLVGRSVTSDYRIALQDGNGRVNHYWNAYFDITALAHKYIVSGEPAARFRLGTSATGGNFDFFGAPPGTAGNTFTWTQYGLINETNVWWSPRGTSADFFINSSGSVGVGTAGPLAKLNVVRTVASGAGVSEVLRLQAGPDNGVSSNTGPAISFAPQDVSAGYYPTWVTSQIGGTQIPASYAGALVFLTNNGGGSTDLSEKMRIQYNGSVGIGTSGPGFKFDVQGGQINSSGGLCIAGDCKTSWSQVGGASQWTTSGSSLYYSTGNVGIGNTTPGSKLDVTGNINATGTINAMVGLNINGSPVTSSQWSTTGTTINYNTGNVGIGNPNPSSKLDVTGNINATGTVNAMAGLNINGSPVTSSQWSTTGTTINYNTGNVGIGNPNPSSKLDVTGNINASGTINAMVGLNINGSPVTSSQWTTNGSNINYATAGNVGIGTPSPGSKLDVTGNTNITGDLNVTGHINARYQDVAEWVPTSAQLPAGTVVVLDSTKSNQVISSTQAYDTRVAGVVSEQPGIELGEGGAGKVLVAATGRVRVNVDASRGAIHIGDLLVTSDITGVAMKSEPINLGGVQLHRPGTLIGKALEPLEKGSGKILVLLSLQ